MNDDQPQKRIIIVFLRYFGYLVLGSALVLVSLFSFWNIQSPEVLVAKNTPFPVRPPQNTAGKTEYVHVNYCKTSKARGEVNLRMIGTKSIIRLPFPVEDSSPQCLDTEVPIVLPTYAVDDTYYFDFAITYRINPIKTVTVDLHSKSFTLTSNGEIVK